MTTVAKGERNPAHLHFFCGLIASGKSTLATKIAREQSAVLLIEDDWLRALWPGELKAIDDYRTRSTRLKSVLWPHVSELLEKGVTVVLDFPANTRAQRETFREFVTRKNTAHILHYLDTPIEVCRERLAARNAAGTHPFEPTLDVFDLFARLFEAPAADEAFTVQTWRSEEKPPTGCA